MTTADVDSCLLGSVLSSFLGAIKTTQRNQRRVSCEGMLAAVVANTISGVDLDTERVTQDAGWSRTNEKVVEMSDGCIRCTLRDDLRKDVRRLSDDARSDHRVIESTAIALPLPISTTCDARDEHGTALSHVVQIDTLVIAADALNLLKGCSSQGLPRNRSDATGDEDNRALVDLLGEQIEFADFVALALAPEAGKRLPNFFSN